MMREEAGFFTRASVPCLRAPGPARVCPCSCVSVRLRAPSRVPARTRVRARPCPARTRRRRPAKAVFLPIYRVVKKQARLPDAGCRTSARKAERLRVRLRRGRSDGRAGSVAWGAERSRRLVRTGSRSTAPCACRRKTRPRARVSARLEDRTRPSSSGRCAPARCARDASGPL